MPRNYQRTNTLPSEELLYKSVSDVMSNKSIIRAAAKK